MPESATPMTAALTVLSYGEKCAVKAHFFSEEDVEIIKRDHREYTEAANETVKERKKASFEQYEQMKASGFDIEEVCRQKEKVIEANNFADIKDKLKSFVGAGGEYMPFTKSVELVINNPALKDFRIVDTPGINDPIKSREARTEQYLRNCDVVFIVSTAGQFLTQQDFELMDRLSTREGVRELFLVASMADLGVLMGNILDEVDGDINKAINMLKGDLSSHASSALKSLKNRHQEIGGQFDSLINNGKDRIIITSGRCNSMFLRYENKSSWSEPMNALFKKLSQNYPDYFDESLGKANLEMLGNVAELHSRLDAVRAIKEKIIADKIADYRTEQSANIEKYRAELLAAIISRVEKIKSSDLQSLEKEIKKLDDFIISGSQTLDKKLRTALDGTKHTLKSKLNECTARLSSAVDNSMSNETQENTKETAVEGFGGGLARFFGGLLGVLGGLLGGKSLGSDGWGYKTTTTTELRAGAVKQTINSGLSQFHNNITGIVDEELSKIKDTLPVEIKKIFLEIDTERILDAAFLHRAVYTMALEYTNGVVWNLGMPAFEYPASGKIADDEIDRFAAAWNNFSRDIMQKYNAEVQTLLKGIDDNSAAKEPAAYIFAELKTRMESLKTDLTEKNTVIEQLTAVTKLLQEAN